MCTKIQPFRSWREGVGLIESESPHVVDRPKIKKNRTRICIQGGSFEQKLRRITPPLGFIQPQMILQKTENAGFWAEPNKSLSPAVLKETGMCQLCHSIYHMSPLYANGTDGFLKKGLSARPNHLNKSMSIGRPNSDNHSLFSLDTLNEFP